MRALALTLLSLLAYTNIAAAATIPTLNNILTSPSKTTSARLAKRSAQVIDPRLHPDWAGELDPNDCERAMALFNNRAPQYSPYLPVWFWSARWMERPSLLNPNFELPFGTRYGSCVLLLRMAKDFGNDVLPLAYGGFLEASTRDAKAQATWFDVTYPAKRLFLDVIQPRGLPAWQTATGIGGSNVVLMFVPETSVIGRDWTRDMRGVVRSAMGDLLIAGNRTVELSRPMK